MVRQNGITRLEVIVVVTIVLVLALVGVLVPTKHTEKGNPRLGKARATVDRIAAALTQFQLDTGTAPTGHNGARTHHFLRSDGGLPLKNRFASGGSAPLSDFLARNVADIRGWSGPYLREARADPWGCAYLVNCEGYWNRAEAVWVLSAGPNRTVDTPPTSLRPREDDIATLVK